MISFIDYAKIANNYCVCYFGQSDEYLVLLRLLKPMLEREFPELTICIGCKDDRAHLLGDCKDVLKLTELKIRKNDFAYISELKCNGSTHPIEDFLIGAKIQNFSIETPITDTTMKCVICTRAVFPTKPLEKHKIDHLKRIARARGMPYELDTDIEGAGLVMGVESVGLCEAAARGIETVLVPSGVGLRLYKNLFPNLEIIDL